MEGMVYIFTGDGKGKTSAALGVAVRAVSAGMKVAMIQWYKEKRWPISEHNLPKKLKGIKIYPMGHGFYKLPTDHATPDQHKQAAKEALNKASTLINQVDVLVLDEVNNAVKDGLIDLIDLISLISKRGKTHLILTGRDVHKKLIKLADLVTEMKKIKHPFDQGRKAVKGLDF
jgi:cob(I)alamin adenosyltransferase